MSGPAAEAGARAWIRLLKPNPHATIRLFAFPHAGAGALAYRPWRDLLPPEIELCAIQMPGRDDRFRETPFTDVDALVSVLARALYPYELSRPFAFYGHSMGALVAFELARALIDRYSLKPRHLFVSARNAPQVPDSRPPLYNLQEPAFIDQLRTLNGTPEELLREPDPMWLRTLRADFELNEAYTYRAGPPLDVPLSAFAGRGDPRVRAADMDGWREHTSSAFTFRQFDAGHFLIHDVRAEVVQAVLVGLTRSGV